MINRLKARFRRSRTQQQYRRSLEQYFADGQKPWTDGYAQHKWQSIEASIQENELLLKFRQKRPLPAQFGYRLDERIIEYPWLFSQLSSEAKRTLDAGSALNFSMIINQMQTLHRDLTICTLAPEAHAFWKHSISYHFGDLRDMPFRDGWFDEIISISTLEHVGAANTLYTDAADNENSGSFQVAAHELWRILKPEGDLYITVPYGLDETISINGSVFMRQFDEPLLDSLLNCFPNAQIESTFYQYHADGWQLSTQADCHDVHYFNIHAREDYDDDFAAAARAVCCLHIQKATSES